MKLKMSLKNKVFYATFKHIEGYNIMEKLWNYLSWIVYKLVMGGLSSGKIMKSPVRGLKITWYIRSIILKILILPITFKSAM